MAFIPHTQQDIAAMLATIGVDSIDQLFDEIPEALRAGILTHVPEEMSEMDVLRLMSDRAASDANVSSFIGAGAYEHHIPSAVWDIATRGEFMTAYTPYQAEASQGTLQLIYEFQSMMTQLTGLDVANASLYDGATALAEAILMAARYNKRFAGKKVLLPRNIHPHYLQTVKTIVAHQGIELAEIDFSATTGQIDLACLAQFKPDDVLAVVIAQPNFFGVMEDVDAMTDWAKSHNALVIGVVNPTSLAALKPPGQWGTEGADIAVGEGQPLGVPVASGGPYFGFMCAKQALVRQMPGRIVGRTTDLDGKEGYTLTLQAREQHIRRGKATSNICTNQGLTVTAATIYLSLLGLEGLKRVANDCVVKTHQLVSELTKLPGVELLFNSPYFHECALRLPVDGHVIQQKMQEKCITPGLNLQPYFPEFGNALLLCVTETKTDADLSCYVDAFKACLK